MIQNDFNKKKIQIELIPTVINFKWFKLYIWNK